MSIDHSDVEVALSAAAAGAAAVRRRYGTDSRSRRLTLRPRPISPQRRRSTASSRPHDQRWVRG